MLFRSLAQILAADGADESLRYQAGLFCKNLFVKRETSEQAEVNQVWLTLDNNVRNQIKQTSMQVLGSTSKLARKGAAAMVARLAVIEISAGQWLDLIDLLTSTATKTEIAAELRATALQTLGWICEDIVAVLAAMQATSETPIENHLENHIAAVLTAVVFGMRPEEDSAVRAVAARALYNTLEFAHSSFEEQRDRDHLMEIVFVATGADNEDVRVEAFKSLVTIGELYYEKIGSYMQRIYEITTGALANGDECEQVKLQAVEFWASLADAETDILIDNEDAALNGGEQSEFFGITKTLFPHLAPVILAVLPVEEGSEPDDLADTDDWTVSMAAAVCLKSVAACIGEIGRAHV